MKIYIDVAVVGSGPSGSAVAKYCAEKGLNVIIIEKKKQIGFPSHCAGYVSKLVTRYFSVPKACIQQSIEKMRTHFPSGYYITADMRGWIVERSMFDKSLCIQALEEGADILINSEAIETKEGKLIVKEKGKNKIIRINPRYIVGADGAASRVAKWIGIKQRRFANCMQYEIAGVSIETPEIAETYFSMEYAPYTYAWIYPTSKTSAKVGVGVIGKNPFIYLNSFMKSIEKFKNAKVFAIYKGLVPLSGIHEKILSGNILLVGDAAGVTDPITGAGILSGIITGKLAARAIAEENVEKYQAMVNKVLGKRLQRSLEKRKIFDEIKNDEELENMLPKLWVTFREFWIDY